MGFGVSAVPAAQRAFADCDCLIAVAVRFAEVATGSYGINVTENLIHIDIDPEVFDKNFKAKVKIAGDAKVSLQALITALGGYHRPENTALIDQIREAKNDYFNEWLSARIDGVNPALFIRELGTLMEEDDYVLSDVGNHTFLMGEHFVVKRAGHFIAPCDFNCMGYAAPASLGVKLIHPESLVAAVIGDGCFLMTCMETLTAASLQQGIIYCIFKDGELAQISQTQKIPYNKKTCTVLKDYNLEGIAIATGAAYLSVSDNSDITAVLQEARGIAGKGQPVIVDVRVSYAKKTAYTKGVITTNLKRFPLKEKIRLIFRIVIRRLFNSRSG
jgi:acetolactate synthase-1/2/3 large subunit